MLAGDENYRGFLISEEFTVGVTKVLCTHNLLDLLKKGNFKWPNEELPVLIILHLGAENPTSRGHDSADLPPVTRGFIWAIPGQASRPRPGVSVAADGRSLASVIFPSPPTPPPMKTYWITLSEGSSWLGFNKKPGYS